MSIRLVCWVNHVCVGLWVVCAVHSALCTVHCALCIVHRAPCVSVHCACTWVCAWFDKYSVMIFKHEFRVYQVTPTHDIIYIDLLDPTLYFFDLIYHFCSAEFWERLLYIERWVPERPSLKGTQTDFTENHIITNSGFWLLKHVLYSCVVNKSNPTILFRCQGSKSSQIAISFHIVVLVLSVVFAKHWNKTPKSMYSQHAPLNIVQLLRWARYNLPRSVKTGRSVRGLWKVCVRSVWGLTEQGAWKFHPSGRWTNT